MFDSHRGHAMMRGWYPLIIAIAYRIAYAPVAQTEEHILCKNVVLVQLHSGAVLLFIFVQINDKLFYFVYSNEIHFDWKEREADLFGRNSTKETYDL